MKAQANRQGMIQELIGSKNEIITQAKKIAQYNFCSVELTFDDGSYNYINYESSPDGEGGRNWEIIVE